MDEISAGYSFFTHNERRFRKRHSPQRRRVFYADRKQKLNLFKVRVLNMSYDISQPVFLKTIQILPTAANTTSLLGNSKSCFMANNFFNRLINLLTSYMLLNKNLYCRDYHRTESPRKVTS